MKRIHGLGVLAAVLAIASMGLVACGGDDKEKDKDKEVVKHRDAMPLVQLKLKNTSPAGGHPASAQAAGTSAGRPTQALSAGPAAPGQQVQNPTPGTNAADSVTVTVSFTGGLTFRGSGSYTGSFISSISVECSEPAGGTATVTFAAPGQVAATITLAP